MQSTNFATGMDIHATFHSLRSSFVGYSDLRTTFTLMLNTGRHDAYACMCESLELLHANGFLAQSLVVVWY